MQKYRPRGGANPTKGFQKWIDEVEQYTCNELVPALRKAGMMLDQSKYSAVNIAQNFMLAMIPDFNTLIAKSQENQKPVYALTEDELNIVGFALENTLATQKQFDSIFSDLVDKIISLTAND